jgi:predicted acyl esterase
MWLPQDSEGPIADEYTAQEQDDVEAAIAWLAAQRWCEGTVEMIGFSRGGFAALQAITAARNPPAPRGIVAPQASDDSHADDRTTSAAACSRRTSSTAARGLDASRNLWSWYADPAIARHEHERIFRRSWQYAGRRDQLTAPGS